jgi:hypothetical protein
MTAAVWSVHNAHGGADGRHDDVDEAGKQTQDQLVVVDVTEHLASILAMRASPSCCSF